MAKILHFLTAIFLIGWAVGFFVLDLGLLVHLLLLAAVLTVIIRIIKY